MRPSPVQRANWRTKRARCSRCAEEVRRTPFGSAKWQRTCHGLQYGNAAQNKKKITEKIASAQQYAQKVFGADEHVFQLWCPRVGLGKNTEWMESMVEGHATQGIHVEFIYNERYTAAVQALINVAKGTKSHTGEPALRMFQILANLKGNLAW